MEKRLIKLNQNVRLIVNNAKQLEFKGLWLIYNTFQENSFDNIYYNLSATKYFVIKG